MKNHLLHWSWLLFILMTAGSFAEQHGMRIIQLHSEFLGNIKYGNNPKELNQLGFGGSMNIGKEHILISLEYNYRKVDMSTLPKLKIDSVTIHEFYAGLRYYPMRPTVMIGNLAIRLTAGAMAGLDLEPQFRTLFFCGLAFSSVTSNTGLTIDFAYRPTALKAGGTIGGFKGYLLQPCWMFRAGLIFGPHL